MAQPSIMLIRVQLRNERQVRDRERLVVGQIGDLRRRVRGGRHHQRVIGREPNGDARHQRAARIKKIDVFRRADRLAAQDAHETRGS